MSIIIDWGKKIFSYPLEEAKQSLNRVGIIVHYRGLLLILQKDLGAALIAVHRVHLPGQLISYPDHTSSFLMWSVVLDRIITGLT